MQRLRRLLRKKSARDAERAFVVEGAKVVGEALDAGAPVQSAFVAPGAPGELIERLLAAGARVHELEPGVMERVADTVTPQPVAAVVGYVDVGIEALREGTMVLACVDVRDPGNAGTVLRTAEAAGADGVICCEGSVDVYNPKTVRASAGSLFHVPVVVGSTPAAVADAVGGFGFTRVATVAREGTEYADVDLTGRVALFLGNEANGLPADVVDRADLRVSIPMAGRTESLNVGMAAAVLCFEAARQRRAIRG
ncbi:MAG: methyltransferase, TrmH family [Actinomycetota bacterium]